MVEAIIVPKYTIGHKILQIYYYCMDRIFVQDFIRFWYAKLMGRERRKRKFPEGSAASAVWNEWQWIKFHVSLKLRGWFWELHIYSQKLNFLVSFFDILKYQIMFQYNLKTNFHDFLSQSGIPQIQVIANVLDSLLWYWA